MLLSHDVRRDLHVVLHRGRQHVPRRRRVIILLHMTHDPQRPGLETEADVDARLVLPTLTALGITAGNVRAQRTFTVRLGRNEVRLGGDVRKGRADYLVTNDENEPLFVLELKGPDEALTDDDRDQAISYARLVHPMAPLAVLSNGSEWRIFDTITKARVEQFDGDTARRGAFLGDDDALRLRAEALEHFVGYSRENVIAFSQAQVRAGMEGLRGDGQHLRKYETELYVPRPSVRALFSQFLQQDRTPVFALGGASGVGKTNEMCALAEACAADHVTLFLHGPDLAASLAAVLADAFAWHFAEALPLPQVCRRLDALARRSGAPVLLFIDAVDEAAALLIGQELGALATQLASFGGSIRLILSAKTLEWRRLLHVRGVETPLARGIFAPAGAAVPASDSDSVIRDSGRMAHVDQAAGNGLRLSWILKRFDAEEAAAAHTRYASAFGLEPALFRMHGDDPFLLRITAEVARDALRRSASVRSDVEVNERTLVRAYLDAKMARMADPERAGRELRVLATALARRPAPAPAPDDGALRGRGRSDAGVPDIGADEDWSESELTAATDALDAGAVPPLAETCARDAARLAAGDPFAEELVAFGILLRLRDADSTTFLAFAYDRVRDYVVATFGFAFPTVSADALAPVVADCMTTSLGRAAFAWYLPYFTADQWTRVEEFAGQCAEASLATYERLRAHVLPPARDAMDHARSYELGVVYSIMPAGGFSLGYFPRWREALPRVLIERDSHGPFREAPERVRRGIHPSVERFRRAPWYLADPTHAAVEHAVDQLSRLLREGHLLTLEPDLRLERVVALTIEHARELGLRTTEDDTFVRFADHLLGAEIFPLDIRDLRQRVQWALAMRWHRSIYGDVDRAAAEARREIAAGRDFAETLVGNGELRALALTLQQLPDDLVQIPSPLLPGPDLPCEIPGAGWSSFERYYSDAQLTAFLHAVFRRALDATRRVLDIAFGPELRELIGPGPTRLDVEGRRYGDDEGDAFGVYRLGLRLAVFAEPQAATNQEDAVTARLVGGVAWENRRLLGVDAARDGRSAHMLRRHEFGSNMLFVPHGSPPVIAGGKTWSGAIQFAPVRAMVHLLLTDTLAACDTAVVGRLARRTAPARASSR